MVMQLLVLCINWWSFAIYILTLHCKHLAAGMRPDSSMTSFSLLQKVDEFGNSGRSQMAVEIQEQVTLSYGSEWQLSKKYDVNRISFYSGESSTGGHFTVAVRQLRNGQYHPGDLWQYLNSHLAAITCTMESLRRVHRGNVTGLLLVAKPIVPAEPLPTIPAGPLPTLQVSRCATFSPQQSAVASTRIKLCAMMSNSPLLTMKLLPHSF